jgi:hypothetical protein
MLHVATPDATEEEGALSGSERAQVVSTAFPEGQEKWFVQTEAHAGAARV